VSSVVPLHPVSTQGTAAAVRQALNFPCTDVGNAAEFVRLHTDAVRYTTDSKTWYAYKNGYWTPNAEAEVQERAKALSAHLTALAANGTNEQRSWAKKTGEAKRVSAIIKLASSDPAITCVFADFDHDPMLLGVANGVIDLRTGAFRPALPSDMLTLRAPVRYVAGADCPLFKRFLRDICCDDPELMVFVLRMLAYCLTGETREQKWFFLHGEHGSNGKSTLLRVLTMVLGNEMVVTVPEGFFTVKKQGYSASESYTMASLARARVAVSPELGENERLAEVRMKMVTGQDRVSARAPYGKPFDFLPHFKVLQLGNDIPSICGTRDNIWRRTLLLPFNARFKPTSEAQPGDKIRINNFEDQLAAELPGILNLLIKQCVKWQRLGLRVPRVVLDKVAENRLEQDTFGGVFARLSG
jgi:putative DNA primase/helicase